jgi:hypothetical protein
LTTPTFSVGEISPEAAPVPTQTAVSRERGILALPDAARPRAPAGPDAGQRPLPAEAGLVLEPDPNVLVGMGLPDGLDLVDDDLLEDRLQPRVGVLVLGAGHEAAEAVAMEQVVDGLELEAHAELVCADAPEVGAVGGADAVLGRGPGLQPLREASQLRAGQAWRATGVGPLSQGLGATAIVAGDPVLDRAHAAAEGQGGRGGGAAL